MARLVRLSPTVGSDEVRVSWHTAPGETPSLGVEGSSEILHMALSHFGAKRLEFAGSLAENFIARRDGNLIDAPSFLEELTALDYDPETLVFSIRKKDAPEPTDVVPVDPRKLVEDAQKDSLDLEVALNSLDTVKDLTVADDDDMENLRAHIARIQDNLAAALKMLTQMDNLAAT